MTIRQQLELVAAPPVVLTLGASCILPTTNFHQNFQNFPAHNFTKITQTFKSFELQIFSQFNFHKTLKN